MTHILTVAMDLNAAVKELPGEDLAAELSALIRSENVTHVTLIAAAGRALLGFRQETIVDRIIRSHPRVNVHLVAARQ